MSIVKTYDSKLIVLRGNSGSGKSTVAKHLRESAANQRIAIVEQDYLRRIILKEKETDGGDNINLIEQTVEFALSKGYDVILEGTLYFPRYGDMLRLLAGMCPENYFFYFDITFEETVRRHATKPNAHGFGEKEMEAWFHSDDRTNFQSEVIVKESDSMEEIVANIVKISRL